MLQGKLSVADWMFCESKKLKVSEGDGISVCRQQLTIYFLRTSEVNDEQQTTVLEEDIKQKDFVWRAKLRKIDAIIRNFRNRIKSSSIMLEGRNSFLPELALLLKVSALFSQWAKKSVNHYLFPLKCNPMQGMTSQMANRPPRCVFLMSPKTCFLATQF